MKLFKGMFLAVLGCSLVLPLQAGPHASAEQNEQQVAVLMDVTVAADAEDFSGAIRMQSDGIVKISIDTTGPFADASYQLVVENERGKVVKRATVSEDDERINLKSWMLDEGDYTIYLEAKLGGETYHSDTVSWEVGEESDDSEPPGSVEVAKDGESVWVDVEQDRSDRGDGSYYLVIRTKKEKLIKQLPIAVKDARYTAQGLMLQPGDYRVYLEWVDGDETLRSNPVDWAVEEVEAPAFPTQSTFPGSLTRDSSGNLEITLRQAELADSWKVELLVTDARQNEVKRIVLYPGQQPKLSKGLGLSTGGYQVSLLLTEPLTGQKVQAKSLFYPVNQTNRPLLFINGVQQHFAQAPVINQGKTMVPLRSIFEALDAKVSWEQASQTVTAIKGGKSVKLAIGKKVAEINGTQVTLDVPAQLSQGTTFVPLRFVSEALGATVNWDAASMSVTIEAK